MGEIEVGDAVLTAYMRDEREAGWRIFKAPKGKRFVLLLLGTCDNKSDGTDIDIDARLNALGWHFQETPE